MGFSSASLFPIRKWKSVNKVKPRDITANVEDNPEGWYRQKLGGQMRLELHSRGSGTHTHVIHVLRECIWNVPAVSLFLPAFDDTSSLGSPPRQVFYPPV